MKQKILSIFTATLLFLSITPAFANSIGLRICVEGDPYPTNSELIGRITFLDWLRPIGSWYMITIDENANCCKTGYYRTKIKTNRALFNIIEFNGKTEDVKKILNDAEIDSSCNTSQITTTRISSSELQSKVKNGHKDLVDWGFEYHLKVPTSTQEKTKLSCKIVA